MPTETYFNRNTGRYEQRKTTTADEAATAESTERLTSAEGLGSKVKPVLKSGRGPFPRQEQGEEPEAYRKRVAAWRASGTSEPNPEPSPPASMRNMSTDDAAEALSRKKKGAY